VQRLYSGGEQDRAAARDVEVDWQYEPNRRQRSLTSSATTARETGRCSGSKNLTRKDSARLTPQKQTEDDCVLVGGQGSDAGNAVLRCFSASVLQCLSAFETAVRGPPPPSSAHRRPQMRASLPGDDAQWRTRNEREWQRERDWL
jgi:hypothetical protein